MAFQQVDQRMKPFSRITTVHFAVVNTPTMKVGRLTVPAEIAKGLGWTGNACLNILAGSGEDKGWYALALHTDPAVKLRPRVRVARNGVARFSTKALVPEDVTGPMSMFEPEFRVEGGALFIKVL
jgi:hypothetical protein